MRLIKTHHEKEWLWMGTLDVFDGLLREVTADHVAIHRTKRQAGAVQPNPRRINERFPRRLDFNPRWQHGLVLRGQPILVFFTIDAQIKTMFEFAVEVHLANRRRIVAVPFKDFCQSNLALRERARELRDAECARVTTGKEGLAGSRADGRITESAIKTH